MARIRSIKPEFPQSETIGKLSRNARLLFIQLWTLVDDDGRARAASRMLASLLYPYDDDAPGMMDGWLDELERNGCVRRYEVDGSRYLDIPNWRKHQKIDHPTKSKLPAFDESSLNLASSSEALAPDLGPRTKERNSVANATAAVPAAPEGDDPRTRLFQTGLAALKRQTGRGEDSCRSLLGKWLKIASDEAIHVLAAIEDAERERVADPVPWIRRRLEGLSGRPAPPSAKLAEGVVIRFDTPEARAWERHNGKAFPWGIKGTWIVPTKFPPGFEGSA